MTGLDALRLACVCAVVVLHVAQKAGDAAGPTWLRVVGGAVLWAVPTLFVLSGFLAGVAPVGRFLPRLGRRASRLLVPYVFWVAVYFAVAWVVPTELGRSLGAWMIDSHLWFLLTLLLCVPAGLVLTDRYSATSAVLMGAVLLGVRYATGWATPLDWHISATYPFLNWLELYVVGVALGRWLGYPRARSATPLVRLAAPVFASVLAAAALYWAVSWSSPLGYIVVGAIAVLLTLLLRVSLELPGWIEALYPVSLGIYVLHPMFATAFAKVVPVAGSTATLWTIVSAACVVVASAVVAVALGRMPVVRRVVS